MGPPLGGLFADYLNWHWIFLINIPVGVVCIIAAVYIMPQDVEKQAKKFDFKGFIF
jgi:predicted MFS family arabinose efflux permease